MPYAHITVDGRTLLNGDLGQWQTKPPAELAQHLKPGTPHQPGIRALLVALGDAVRMNKNTSIQLTNRDTGYDLKVNYQ